MGLGVGDMEKNRVSRYTIEMLMIHDMYHNILTHRHNIVPLLKTAIKYDVFHSLFHSLDCTKSNWTDLFLDLFNEH